MPSPQAVREFQELYLARYGVLLSEQDALERAGRLLRFYKTVYTGNPLDAVTYAGGNHRDPKTNSITREK
jgi:hypothetical protein